MFTASSVKSRSRDVRIPDRIVVRGGNGVVENEGGQADSLSVHALAGGEAPSRRKQLQGSSASGPQSGAAAGSRRPEPYKIEKKGSSS